MVEVISSWAVERRSLSDNRSAGGWWSQGLRVLVGECF